MVSMGGGRWASYKVEMLLDLLGYETGVEEPEDVLRHGNTIHRSAWKFCSTCTVITTLWSTMDLQDYFKAFRVLFEHKCTVSHAVIDTTSA